jgi:hypothetical protein
VIEDESEGPSGTPTPASIDEKTALMAESNAQSAEGSANGSDKGGDNSAHPAGKVSSDLPADVRAKLRKLENLESKYKGMPNYCEGSF